MNKTPILLIALSVFCIGLISFQYQAQTIKDYCTSSASRKKSKVTLKPYQYDTGKTNKITFKAKEQKREIEVPLFIGERYRFVFNTEGLPQPIGIDIYSKKSTSKKRELLFSNKDIPAEQTEFIFEPEKSKTLFVTYSVPVTNDTIKKGCVLFILGYQSKLKKGTD
jgi:hypothetical protein